MANRPGQAWPVFLRSKTDGTNIVLAAAEGTCDGVDRQYLHWWLPLHHWGVP